MANVNTMTKIQPASTDTFTKQGFGFEISQIQCSNEAVMQFAKFDGRFPLELELLATQVNLGLLIRRHLLGIGLRDLLLNQRAEDRLLRGRKLCDIGVGHDLHQARVDALPLWRPTLRHAGLPAAAR